MRAPLASSGWLIAIAPFLAAHLHSLAGTLVIPRLKPPLARVLFFTSKDSDVDIVSAIRAFVISGASGALQVTNGRWVRS